MSRGPISFKGDVRVVVDPAEQCPVAQMGRGAVACLHRARPVRLCILNTGVGSGEKDVERRAGNRRARELGFVVGDNIGNCKYLRLFSGNDADAVPLLPRNLQFVAVFGKTHLGERICRHTDADGHLPGVRRGVLWKFFPNARDGEEQQKRYYQFSWHESEIIL